MALPGSTCEAGRLVNALIFRVIFIGRVSVYSIVRSRHLVYKIPIHREEISRTS